MRKLFIIILISTPFLLQAQSKSLEALKEKYKDIPNSFDMNMGGDFLGMTNWIPNEEDDQEIKELVKSISNMHLTTLPKGENGIDSKTLAKLKKDMQKEAYEELLVLREGKDHINMLVKERKGVISSLVMLIENKNDLTILDFSGAIDINSLSTLADNVNLEVNE